MANLWIAQHSCFTWPVPALMEGLIMRAFQHPTTLASARKCHNALLSQKNATKTTWGAKEIDFLIIWLPLCSRPHGECWLESVLYVLGENDNDWSIFRELPIHEWTAVHRGCNNTQIDQLQLPWTVNCCKIDHSLLFPQKYSTDFSQSSPTGWQ